MGAHINTFPYTYTGSGGWSLFILSCMHAWNPHEDPVTVELTIEFLNVSSLHTKIGILLVCLFSPLITILSLTPPS